MSALDLAKLSRHIITNYPAYYHYFSERSFVCTTSPSPTATWCWTRCRGPMA